MKKNRNTIFVSVLGILTLIVATVGVTFAYFTTSMSGSAANVSATTATIGKLSYTADPISATSILPGWTSGNKSVKVTLAKSDYPASYTCSLTVTANGITDLTLTTSGTNAVTQSATKVESGKTYQIASGTLASSTTSSSATTNYSLTFKETGTDQNTQSGKTVTGTVSCVVKDNQIYYNNSNTGGTTTKPSAQ